MKALLLGPISVVVDTSELQRAAFNQAFEQARLRWHWSRADYRDMLQQSGGHDRVVAFAKAQNVEVNTAALHASKTAIFQQMLRKAPLVLRPETSRVLQQARYRGARIGFVSGTAKASIDALLAGLGDLGLDLVTSADDATSPKPDPMLYTFALQKLGIAAEEALAIEDNRAGIDAAVRAGIKTLAYPNANTQEHNFSDVTPISTWDIARAA